MNLRTVLLFAGASLLLASSTLSQLAPTLDEARRIVFPDVPGYETLVTDLHTHSVFSDGSVWPDIRIQEALKDGLDAVAITEHLEYQPHADDIPHPDHNRAHELGSEFAADTDLIVIRGSEVTRDMPPGHANAVFLEDTNALLVDDPIDALREAKRQGGFVFWNHPHWTGQRRDGVAVLTDVHRRLIEDGLLDGIEVINDVTYSDEALAIALEHDLTIIGTSDVHGLVDWRFDVPGGGHRPVTLVFAAQRSEEGIQDGLEAGRTVAYLGDLLVGREELMVPLVEASLEIGETAYRSSRNDVLTTHLENRSSARWVLRNTGDHRMQNHGDVITVEPHATVELQVKTLERLPRVELQFEVLSAVVAPHTHPTVRLGRAVD